MKALRVRKSADSQPGAAIDFAGLPGLVEAVLAFQNQAEQLDRATEQAAGSAHAGSEDLAKLNAALAKVERAFLLEDGLPGRPWFKHAVYAPGLTTGYASWPLPAVRQRLEEEKTPDAKLASDAARTVERIKAAAAALEEARRCASRIAG
jgi:N-acetylated-alpha-linked acidic dipeptidase